MRTRGLVSRTDGFLTGAIRDAKLSRRLSFFLQLIELVVHGLEADPELGGGRGLCRYFYAVREPAPDIMTQAFSLAAMCTVTPYASPPVARPWEIVAPGNAQDTSPGPP